MELLHIPVMSWILLLRMRLHKKKGNRFKVDLKKSVKGVKVQVDEGRKAMSD